MLVRCTSIILVLTLARSQVLEPGACTGAVCAEGHQPVSSALLQVKRNMSEKSVIAERPTEPVSSLISQAPDLSYTGASAPLTEAGYASMASMCCPAEAKVFGWRVAINLGYDVCNWGDVGGLMMWFFCSTQNRTLALLESAIIQASTQGLDPKVASGECAWVAAPGACKEKDEDCPDFSGVGDPSNIIGTRGTCCYPSAATAFEFAGATVVSNNLGGKGSNPSEPQELRYTGAGTKDGRSLDLVVTADTAYTPGGNNGLNGLFGQISVWAGTSVDLTFNIVDTLSKAPVVLDEFYVSFLDIDEEKSRIREQIYVTYGAALVDRVLEPASPAISETLLPDGRTLYESLDTAGSWNNPTDPMQLGEVTNPTGSTYGVAVADQRKEALMFIYRKTSSWKLTLEVTHTEGAPHGRNFIFGGTSALIDICPRKQEAEATTTG